MEPRSKRLEKTSRLALAMGFGLLMIGVMMLSFFLAKHIESSELLFFSIMFMAFSSMYFAEYGRVHRLAVKEELREYIDSRLNEVIVEIRKLETKQPVGT
jgi:hypothetical protein